MPSLQFILFDLVHTEEVCLFGKLYNNKPLMFMRSGQRFAIYWKIYIPVVLSERFLQSINLSILN